MDNNWLMMALQSPEGMNFLNMWRQKQGVGSAAGAMPGTGGMNPGTYTGGGSFPGTGGMNPGTYNGSASAIGGLSRRIGSSPVMPQTQTSTPSFGGGISRMPQMGGGSNDFSQQAGMMPFYQNGN